MRRYFRVMAGIALAIALGSAVFSAASGSAAGLAWLLGAAEIAAWFLPALAAASVGVAFVTSRADRGRLAELRKAYGKERLFQCIVVGNTLGALSFLSEDLAILSGSGYSPRSVTLVVHGPEILIVWGDASSHRTIALEARHIHTEIVSADIRGRFATAISLGVDGSTSEVVLSAAHELMWGKLPGGRRRNGLVRDRIELAKKLSLDMGHSR
jgi:hypothetical protein